MAESVMDQLLREVREMRARIEEGPSLPAALTLARAASELSISVRKLRGMIDRADILACQVGRTMMIPRSEIERITTPQRPAPTSRRSPAPKRKGSVRSEADRVRATIRGSQ